MINGYSYFRTGHSETNHAIARDKAYIKRIECVSVKIQNCSQL